MKALVVGCGSIGRRHIENLLKAKDITEIVVCSKRKEGLVDLMAAKKKISTRDSIEGADADIAIISNETYKHIGTAIKLAEKGINLFIEKPLSHSLAKVGTLRAIAKKRGIKLTIGYNLRFLAALKYVKRQLAGKTIGDLYFAKIEVGQYLPLWRAGRDYAKTYSARKRRGGGVALDLSHELDYMRYLFGEPLCQKVVKSKVSKLKIDSEDLFEGIFLFKGGFICGVHLDYLQTTKMRNLRIVGSKGVLVSDFVKKEIRIIKNGRQTIVRNRELFDIDKTYADEMTAFIRCVKNGQKPSVTLEDGIKALRLAK